MKRGRSQGWKYAKESGHANEVLMSCDNGEFIKEWVEILNILKNGEVVLKIVNNAGISQKKELSVLGHKTTPKVDNVIITNFRKLKISLKKSLGGQVLLTSSDNFFNTLNKMYNVEVNSRVIETMKLFTGENSDGVREILKQNEVNRANQKCSRNQRERRLNGEALLEHNPDNVRELLNFFSENMVEITKMVFSTGSVINKDSHADFIYYKNLVDKSKSANTIFNIEDIVKNVSNKPIVFGPKNGGTTITLPFGHLQMHKNILQIHHNYEKINFLVQY